MQNGKIKKIWELLDTIPDPEIPVISLVELGVIRDVIFSKNSYIICITPTYSGCPAFNVFQDDIKRCFQENNIKKFELKTIYAPAWTTDWMTQSAKRKLKEYGIAPPGSKVICPQCNSKKTELISEFGATACKALYKCSDCMEPFEFFKCI